MALKRLLKVLPYSYYEITLRTRYFIELTLNTG